MKRMAVTEESDVKKGSSDEEESTDEESNISKYLLSSFMPKKLTLAINKECYK